jgi:hypothetical protein
MNAPTDKSLKVLWHALENGVLFAKRKNGGRSLLKVDAGCL